MPFSSREFDPQTDIVAIRDFLSSLVTRIGQDRMLHTGDWLWQIARLNDRAEADRGTLRVWTAQGGAIAGFCWFTPPGRMEIQVDPAVSPDGGIEREMLAWALERQRARPDRSSADLESDAFERDDRKISILESLGFRPSGDDVYNQFWQRLGETVVDAPMPEGGSVRSIAGVDDWSDRVAIHREVWNPSRFTATSYDAVRSVPGFRPELDLVAVAPDGRFAAYCICWYDPVNRTGEFEPVGTRAGYRRQGFARAVIAEGLRRLRALGAADAMVISAGENAASNALYAACGFTLTGQDRGYRRTADAVVDR